jgi:hypothetical protein
MMSRHEELDRRKAMVMGLIGGAVGVIAMRTYWQMLTPYAFHRVNNYWQALDVAEKLPAVNPVRGGEFRPAEASTAAVGRAVYERVTGHEPESELDETRLRDAVLMAWGLAAGALYGYTRTTTRGRDIAGGFFYGIRLWFGDEILVRLLGLRADPRLWSRRQHLVWLTGHWVYSFITTNLTRVLYRAL